MRRNGATLGANRDVGVGIGQQVAIPLGLSSRPAAEATTMTLGPSFMYSNGVVKRLPELRMVQQQRCGRLAEAGADAQVAPESPSADAVGER